MAGSQYVISISILVGVGVLKVFSYEWELVYVGGSERNISIPIWVGVGEL